MFYLSLYEILDFGLYTATISKTDFVFHVLLFTQALSKFHKVNFVVFPRKKLLCVQLARKCMIKSFNISAICLFLFFSGLNLAIKL